MTNQDAKPIEKIINSAKKYIKPHAVSRKKAENIYADMAKYADTLESHRNILSVELAESKYNVVSFRDPTEGSAQHSAASAYAAIKELRFVNLVHNVLCDNKRLMDPPAIVHIDEIIEELDLIDDGEIENNDTQEEESIEESIEEQKKQVEDREEILSFLNEQEPTARRRYHQIFNYIASQNQCYKNLKSPYDLYIPRNVEYTEPSTSSDGIYNSIEDYMTGNYELAVQYAYEEKIIARLHSMESMQGNMSPEEKKAEQRDQKILFEINAEDQAAAQKPINVPKSNNPGNN